MTAARDREYSELKEASEMRELGAVELDEVTGSGLPAWLASAIAGGVVYNLAKVALASADELRSAVAASLAACYGSYNGNY